MLIPKSQQQQISGFFAFFTLWLLPAALSAQEKTEKAVGPTLESLIDDGGMPLKVLFVVSIFTVFLILFFLFTFRAGALFPTSFLRNAEQAAAAGEINDLRVACAADSSAASSIITAALEQVSASGQVDYFVLRDAIEDEGSRQANLLWQRLQYLNDVAIVSPMIGLLGTVLGMMHSFGNLESELASGKPLSLSEGIAQALVTTAAGLFLGITAMVLYAAFRGRVNRLIVRLEEVCSRILQKFISTYNPELPEEVEQ